MLNLQKEFTDPWEYVIDLKGVYISIQTVLSIEKIEIGNISYVLMGNWILLWVWNNCFRVNLIIFLDCHCSGGSKWSSIILASNNSN